MAHNEGNKPFQRLPQNVKPILYDITLKPDLVNFTFAGIQSVQVEVVSSTNSIVLNSTEIDIVSASFSSINDGTEIQGSISYDEKEERVILTFNETIKPGKGHLKLVFNGILNDKMVGFYRTQYRSPLTNKDEYAATTQFEPTDARRAFPCWDEPSIKAQFNITIIAPKNRMVLSNTNIIKEETDPSNELLKIVSFETTPIMSTYLVAFVVGEYEELESATARGTRIRVYAPLGKKGHGTFALDDAVKYIEFFEDYFKINYPLSKLDHISVPDFAFNAMENWGLVTYRETALLIDPENSSCSAKQSVAQVIAHETAHQWFGDLVTMEWWTHLWLNEGFATFMQYLAVESHHPEFEFWKQFAAVSSIAALELDGSHESHPIEIPVGAPAEINSIFDHISYHKGASVIRMCHNWIGDQAFRDGMKDYLTMHAYKNASTGDLWKALEKASKKPVEKMMPTWTCQMGYPLITVSISSVSDTSVVINLKQEKFCIDGKMSDSESNMLWSIPISLVTSSKPGEAKQFDLFSDRSMNITLDSFSLKNGWFKLNPSLYGFYRVNYPVDMWKALGQAVKNKTLEPLDRLQLIDDILALNLAGIVSVAEVLKMLQNYDDEDDYVAWCGVDKCLSHLDILISYTDSYESFQKFGKKLVSKAYERLGFDQKPGEANTTSLMRSLVLSRLIGFKDDNVIAEAKKKFQAHVNGQSLSPDLRHSVYIAVVKSGDSDFHETLLKLYNQTELQEEKVRIATALGATLDDKKIQQTLEFSFSEHVRTQNSWQVIVSVASTSKGRLAAWKFYEKNISEVKERYGSHRSSSVLIEKLCQNFASEEMAQKITDFFEKNHFPGLEKVVSRAIEKIRVNTAWLNREVAPLREFFSTH